MRRLWSGIVVTLLVTSALAAESGFKPLFNGKDLAGWRVDTPGVWSVRDGMIVGKSPGLRHNDFLRTEKEYGDFVLKLLFRLVNGTGNSGIQFRSKTVPDSHEISGYQADIGETYWGCLYDESRRNRVIAPASPEALAAFRKDGWNEYTITATGNRIVTEVNGVRSVDYVERDADIAMAGIIALQVHAGAPFEVQFKDIRIKERTPL
jgi:hypothetical protein